MAGSEKEKRKKKSGGWMDGRLTVCIEYLADGGED